MSNRSASHDGIALVAPVSVPYVRKTTQPASYFIGTALRQIIKSAGIVKEHCDGLIVSSFSLAPDTVASLAEQFDMSLKWIDQVPLGGASGVISLRRAARAVEAGDAEMVACIGGDTFLPSEFEKLLGRFTNATFDAVTPYAAGGANLPFAMLTQRYLSEFQLPREALGKLCMLQRNNAIRYRQSLFKLPLTMSDYLGARMIAEPLGLFDCVMPCAGAEGLLVMKETKAQELGVPYARLRSSGERHNAASASESPLLHGWGEFQSELYSAANTTPDALDIVQVYDDYPIMAVLQLEELGLCELGQATNHLVEDGFMLDGRLIQINTSGGQLSSGQAGFAGGFLGMVEAVRQLTDSALGNQLSNVRRALVSGFGMIHYQRGLCTAAAIMEASQIE